VAATVRVGTVGVSDDAGEAPSRRPISFKIAGSTAAASNVGATAATFASLAASHDGTIIDANRSASSAEMLGAGTNGATFGRAGFSGAAGVAASPFDIAANASSVDASGP